MIHVDYTTLREIQRNSKRVSEEVNKQEKSFIVMSNNRPQFAIVSLNLLAKLQKPHDQDDQEVGAALLRLINWAEKKDFDLPSDLSEKHDEYLWNKPEKLEK